MRRIVWQLLCLAVVAAVSVLLTLAAMRGPNAGENSDGISLSYSDFISALLTAVTIILAVVAALIAIGAFWSVKEIKVNARKVATRHARHAVSAQLKELPARIQTQVELELPGAVDEQVKLQVTRMADSGELAELIERATAARLMMDPTADMELQPEFDAADNEQGER